MSDEQLQNRIGRDCDLCDNEAVDTVSVMNEATGEMADANLCEECRDRTERHTRGEDVDWSEVLD